MGDRRSRRVKRLLVGIGELAIALTLVAVFFMIFLGIYGIRLFSGWISKQPK